MITSKCLVCGSYDLRADRALSGRLVCIQCGNPFGVRKIRRNKLINSIPFLLNKRHLLYIFILIVAFILVII